MIRKKLVFLGTKPIGYDCFAYLLENRQDLNLEITGLLTKERREFSREKDLASLARTEGIPIFGSPDEIPECDILYSVQYHKILKEEHISKAAGIAVNLHMAPLPEYRGCNQFSFAIIDGRTTFGTTIHKIDARIDHGDILFQKRFPIPEGCWVDQLYHLTAEASLSLFKETLDAITRGQYTSTPQKSLEAEHGCSLHFRQEIDLLKRIDLAWEKDKIEKHIRATTMPGFEPPYIMIDGKKIHLAPTK